MSGEGAQTRINGVVNESLGATHSSQEETLAFSLLVDLLPLNALKPKESGPKISGKGQSKKGGSLGQEFLMS